MASRLISRSKTLALSHRLLHNPFSPTDLIASVHSIPAAGSLASNPLPYHRSARESSQSSTDLPAAAASNLFAWVPCLYRPTVLGHATSREICSHGKIHPSCTLSSFHGSVKVIARSFHKKAQSGELMRRADNMHLRDDNMLDQVNGVKDKCLEQKRINRSKVTVFSPLEGSLTKGRKSGLLSESLKVKRMELSIKITYALIPLFLLISKSKLTSSMLVLCIYWQIYGFFREIFLDYVHHEVTRKWVLIYFKLLLFILAKDTILVFDLV